jgi:exodeoxyribonuclease VII large subunit
VGEGQLFQQFLRLKAALEAEGLFDEAVKRPVPPFPARIGIITSSTGAALQDMLNTLRQRYPLAEVILAPCAVQGIEAPFEIESALRKLNQSRLPDVILLARGGGSLEDLWAFNDERVVRAIRASAIPVIAGVGHETDFTLADFAADVRAPTPTGAAVAATPNVHDLKVYLSGAQQHLLAAFQEAVDRRRDAFERSRTAPAARVSAAAHSRPPPAHGRTRTGYAARFLPYHTARARGAAQPDAAPAQPGSTRDHAARLCHRAPHRQWAGGGQH